MNTTSRGKEEQTNWHVQGVSGIRSGADGGAQRLQVKVRVRPYGLSGRVTRV